MPYLSKDALSQYFRTDCRRQLRLNLSPHNARYRPERSAQRMPDPQDPLPGLPYIKEEGERWQAKKVADLVNTFGQIPGPPLVVAKPKVTSSGKVLFDPVDLKEELQSARPGMLLVEAEYDVRRDSTFENNLYITFYRSAPYNLDYAKVRPDIIEILPPGRFGRYVTPSGEVGNLEPGDGRMQLRVIDIKLTSSPSQNYFAEVAYYMMALAGWLIDEELADKFVVVADGAIWAGSHEASALATTYNALKAEGKIPGYDELHKAMAKDLEPAPFEVLALRVRRFLREELKEVLQTPWNDFPPFVDNRCQNCEYLGYDWSAHKRNQLPDGQTESVSDDQNGGGAASHSINADWCLPTTERIEHLSRVPDMTTGAAAALQDLNVSRVSDLAKLPDTHAAFDAHQMLRSTRTVVSRRAQAVHSKQTPYVEKSSGTSAVMPRWSDLSVCLSADFDTGSAITFAFGVRAFWIAPIGSPEPRQSRAWEPKVFVVEDKTIEAERRELLNFLNHINEILKDVRDTLTPQGVDSTVQFYLWDSLQFQHMTRVFGRHLQAILSNMSLHDLAWLFPPEELLPNPSMSTHMSPITIVRDVVRNHVVTSIPHYYTLLEVARRFQPPKLTPAMSQFKLPALFEAPLSDQIPSERGHEIWAKSSSPHWQDQMDKLKWAVRTRLNALDAVRQQLREELKDKLTSTAPKIRIAPPSHRPKVSVDGQLWYGFAKLNVSIAQLEVLQKRAMPPHEREARFHSALLTTWLTGPDEARTLSMLGLPAKAGRRVYQLGDKSREVRVRAGEFNVALCPANETGFLDKEFNYVVRNTQLVNPEKYVKMDEVLGVTVAGLDRSEGLIAVDLKDDWRQIVEEMESLGVVNLSGNVMLDPTHRDYFTGKLETALVAVGNPPIAYEQPLVELVGRVEQATGKSKPKSPKARRTKTVTPVAEFLWKTSDLASTPVSRNIAPARDLVAQFYALNDKQWKAWEAALTNRLQLVWGPPGTGKTRTAKATLLGALVEAVQQGRPVRILICASTYRAMDHVLLPLYHDVQRALPGADILVKRLRSYRQPKEARVPSEVDTELNKYKPSANVLGLRERLKQREEITLVGSTPEQVFNLLTVNGESAQQEFFDLILIDEGSQMDVAHAILPISGLASGGTVVITGDPKQLPPIHQAEPPKGLEGMVGSVYVFCNGFRGVPDLMLNENYRSNSKLVEFSLTAGYRPNLRSYSPDLRLDIDKTRLSAQPADWHPSLYWTQEWAEMLDPDRPAVAFVYPEGRSSQWNRFEADAVAALLFLLEGHLPNQLANELVPPNRSPKPTTGVPYTPEKFWQEGVGIVTPHRAQQGLIISRLQEVFAGRGSDQQDIRDAVDTVERFQGQERDFIVASFALGDPDAIGSEDEFLYSLNRFNVMASRAKAKLIVLMSQQVLNHLSSDVNTLHASRMLKLYAESFCSNPRSMRLGYSENGVGWKEIEGVFRYR